MWSGYRNDKAEAKTGNIAHMDNAVAFFVYLLSDLETIEAHAQNGSWWFFFFNRAVKLIFLVKDSLATQTSVTRSSFLCLQ